MSGRKNKALRKLAHAAAKVDGRLMVEKKQMNKRGQATFSTATNHPNTARAKLRTLKRWKGKEPPGYIQDDVLFLHSDIAEDLK